MRQNLLNKLKQIIARDHINDRDRLNAIKNARDLMTRIETFYASPGGVLFGLSAEI